MLSTLHGARPCWARRSRPPIDRQRCHRPAGARGPLGTLGIACAAADGHRRKAAIDDAAAHRSDTRDSARYAARDSSPTRCGVAPRWGQRSSGSPNIPVEGALGNGRRGSRSPALPGASIGHGVASNPYIHATVYPGGTCPGGGRSNRITNPWARGSSSNSRSTTVFTSCSSPHAPDANALPHQSTMWPWPSSSTTRGSMLRYSPLTRQRRPAVSLSHNGPRYSASAASTPIGDHGSSMVSTK